MNNIVLNIKYVNEIHVCIHTSISYIKVFWHQADIEDERLLCLGGHSLLGLNIVDPSFLCYLCDLEEISSI